MDDLVERLQTAVTYGYMPHRMREVADEAAARITALEAEVARLGEALDTARRNMLTLRLFAESIKDWRRDADMLDEECGNEPRTYCEDVELMEQSADYALRLVNGRYASAALAQGEG